MTRLPPFSSLLSPPESALLTDFGSQPQSHLQSRPSDDKFAMGATKQSPEMARAMQPMSPPISPQVALQSKPESSSVLQGTHASIPPDPVLFPESTQRHEPSTDALFPYASDDLLKHAVTGHIARRDARNKSEGKGPLGDYPTEEQYLEFLHGIKGFSGAARVGSIYGRNPVGYIKAVIASNNHHLAVIRGRKPERKISPKPSSSTFTARIPKSSRVASEGRVQKPVAAKRAPAKRQTNSPKVVLDGVTDDKMPPKKKTEDVDFAALEDLSPNINTLDDGRISRLHVDWTANPLNLSQDPHRHLLHDSEIKIASALRLSCATYLCSKRRIFLARRENQKIGKEFRKTDAQQACKIDVNKASRLWQAYKSVGWFAGE